MAVFLIDFPTVTPIVWLTVIYSIGGAFMEVVCQGLMVVEARKDAKGGSEDLQTFAWLFYGVGGSLACLAAGWLTTQWPYGGGARITYGVSAIFCLILGLSGPCIDKKLEENQTEMVNMAFWPRTKFVFKELGEGLKIKELYTSLIYQMVIGCLVPQFTTFLYYYYTDFDHFTNFTYAMLQLIAMASLVPGSILFAVYLKESEFRLMMVLACCVNFFGAFTTMLYCSRHTFGLSPFLFVMFTSTVTDVLYMCFIQLPLSVLFAKLIPERIESSLFAFSTGMMNLANLFIAPDLGNLINALFFHITTEDLSELWKLYAVQSVMSLLPILFIWLLPKRAEVMKVQNCLEYMRLLEAKPATGYELLKEAFDKLDEPHIVYLKLKAP